MAAQLLRKTMIFALIVCSVYGELYIYNVSIYAGLSFLFILFILYVSSGLHRRTSRV